MVAAEKYFLLNRRSVALLIRLSGISVNFNSNGVTVIKITKHTFRSISQKKNQISQTGFFSKPAVEVTVPRRTYIVVN